jgi:photosystem II stability/assembly factor-like uncharacterized protein
MKAKRQVYCLRCFSAVFIALMAGAAMAQTNFWAPTSGPEGGDVRTLAINPANGNIFAGTYGYGIFRSTNNGENWMPVNTGLTINAVLSLAINKSTGHIFAGTGFLFGRWASGAIFRSIDNGETWIKVKDLMTDGDTTAVFSLAINARGEIFAGTESRGVFRSTDNGDTWKKVNNGLTNLTIHSLAINNSTGDIFAGTIAGVFRSTDNGDNWVQANNGLTDVRVYALAINANGNVFAGTRRFNAFGIETGGAIFRSTDNGGTWAKVKEVSNNGFLSLAINSARHIFAGSSGGGIFRSTDGDVSWPQVNTGLANNNVKTLAINSAGQIFAGTPSGVFRSMDNGDTWQEANQHLIAQNVSALVIKKNGHVFAGTNVFLSPTRGVLRSTDGGNAWTEVNNGLTNRVITSLALNSNEHIFAGTLLNGVFRSMDNGDSWTALTTTGLTNRSILSLVINARGDIFAGTDGGGIFRLLNGSAGWESVNTGLTNRVVRSFAINSSNGYIFAGTAGGVFRSTDNGNTWMPANTGLTDQNVHALAINANGNIFAGTRKISGFFESGGTIFRSTDHGESWTKVHELSNKGFTSLVINKINGTIFAGTAGNGVFCSIDNGNQWPAVNSGLTSLVVSSLAIDNSTGDIFAGTDGSGVFRSIQSTLAPFATTSPATNITATTATVNGVVNPNGLGTTLRFEYGTTTDYGDSIAVQSPIKSLNDVAVSAALTDLSPHTTYHYRLVATNNAGTSKGEDQTFNTLNRPPVAANVIANQTITIGAASFMRNLNATPAVFTDPDADSLSYSASSSAPNIATANLTGSTLRVVAVAAGSATITITANDGYGGAVSTTFKVTVNRRPNVTNAIADQVINLDGSPFTRDLNAVFNDPDGDTLTYTGTSSAPNIASASVSSATLTVSPGSAGTATIIVRANDHKGGTAADTFNVKINRRPVVVNRIPDQQLKVGDQPFRRNLNASPFIFSDPDQDRLTYAAAVSPPNAASATISGDTLTVVPLMGGVATITISADDGNGGKEQTDFKVTIIGPPSIAHTAITSRPSGQPIVVQAIISDDQGLNTAELLYRRSGNAGFTKAPMTLAGSAYQATIPGDSATSRGVDYYLTALDTDNLTARQPATGFFSIAILVPNVTKSTAQPNGSQQSAYRLISTPLDLDNKSPQAVLEDDLGKYDDTKWRFSELVANQTYVEFPNTSAMTPGKAFWLLVKDAGKAIDTDAGRSNATNREFKIALHSGWNFVGNPFNFTIPIKNISLQSGKPVVLRVYNGSWNEPTITPVNAFIPFEGYAVFNELSSVDTLLVNPDLSASSTSFSKQAASRSESYLWAIRILAQCQEARDVDNAAAIIAGASKNFDASDRPEPPVIGEYVSVSFPHRDWAPPTPSYCIDARPEFARGEIWEFEVTTNIRDKVHLTFDGLEQAPNQFAIWVVDEALNVSQNLREKNQYAVAGTNQSKRLKLVVGRRDFVAEQLGKVNVIPAAYELSQNFPNPFNPATTIRFGLPKAERVTLKVYTLLGEEVLTLINDDLKAAGYHIAIWDGRNQNGRQVATGLYFYRLRAGSFVMTKKMALVQ